MGGNGVDCETGKRGGGREGEDEDEEDEEDEDEDEEDEDDEDEEDTEGKFSVDGGHPSIQVAVP